MTNNSRFDSLGYYNILKVTPLSSDEDIRKNYRELAKFWHPDHNTNPQALDMFQRLSVAYNILKDPILRQKYTLLSIIYNSTNFPDINALLLLRNMHGQEDLNLRAFHLKEVTGKGLTHSVIDKIYYCSQYEAAGVIERITTHNWLRGFWGIGAFFANIKAIIQNILNINGRLENLTCLLHNSLVYFDEKKYVEAATLAHQAKNYALDDEKEILDAYIRSLHQTSILSTKKWDFRRLRNIQLFYPVVFILVLCLIIVGIAVSQIDASSDNSSSVKQTVIYQNGRKVYSDVAVAKIIDIPVDVYDKKALYHFIKTTNAMHGADDEFDIFQAVEVGTTVRVTGHTVDKKWYRVMFDSGEVAFVKADTIVQGTGKAIPLWSKIYKE